jgi:hypothetical protein
MADALYRADFVSKEESGHRSSAAFTLTSSDLAAFRAFADSLSESALAGHLARVSRLIRTAAFGADKTVGTNRHVKVTMTAVGGYYSRAPLRSVKLVAAGVDPVTLLAGALNGHVCVGRFGPLCDSVDIG